jgi:sterol desaturase/sphingolipid hydroxylase (fatty acid hydroxylase superfamily)
MRMMIKYAFYPFLLLATLAVSHAATSLQWDLKKTLWIVLPLTVMSMILAETFFPLAGKWKMTRASFFRDIKYLAISGMSIGLVRTGFASLAILYSERHTGPLASAPIWIGAVVYLVVFEFFQYGFHRFSHEGKGALGVFLWRSHVAHHLPDKVYVVMHAVFHPLNAAITAVLVQAPMILLGLPPGAVFIATLMIDLQTTLSHCNVDIRAGWLNYVLVGPELHRRHHSADSSEAKNYGSVLPIWDILFGTFRYVPGTQPSRIGVEDPSLYPESGRVLEVLALPFRNPDVTGRVGETLS